MSGGFHAPLWPLGIAAPFMVPTEPTCIYVAQGWPTVVAPLWERTRLAIAPDTLLAPGVDATILGPRWEATLIDAEGCG